MKLRLPIQLLRALVLMCGLCSVQAAVMHSAVSYNTYVDFASNAGRFAVGTTNELLEYIRERDNGVRIEYTNGETSAPLPHGMISFDSVADMGNGTLINYNYLVTVKHNATLDPTFGANKYGVGPGNELKYKGIEEEGSNGCFVMDSADPNADYKLIRLSKLVTDATSANLYYPAVVNGKTQVESQLVYRVGGGNHQVKGADGEVVAEYAGGGYNVGGIGSLTSWEDIKINDSTYPGVYSEVKGKESWALNGLSAETPLPFGSLGGDSGSPYFAWNENAETPGFELLMVHRGSLNKGETMYADADPYWTREAIEQQSVRVDMAGTDGMVIIKGIEKSDDNEPSIEDYIKGEGASVATQVSVAPSYGYLYKGNGTTIVDDGGNALKYAGVETPTWKSLHDLKDKDTWYTYGNDRLNATASVVLKDKNHVLAEGLTYAKLYTTQNLVFGAEKDNETYTIKVDADTDLGVGYVRFAAEKCSGVVFNVESAENKLLNSAGYVVDAGVQVNVKLRNVDPNYMREWRKVGEGTLNICGSGGNNEIFLNVGGKGKTLLNQEEGYYAAYNVLVNTGSTVVIADTGQIKRDLTFGNGGGTLDMNGNKMDWYLSEGQKQVGFTIHALTEEAVISNSSSERAELSFMEGGNQSFVGSFCDSKDSALGITYAGGGTWELNSIRTCLENADSGLIVANGTVKLAGTLTVHGHGSLVDSNGRPVYDTDGHALFATRDKDWHYADATMNVTVKNGAAFELESHARLTGTVTVESGGKYIMHEGVQDDYEYIEGGEKLESTAAIRDYYGHKGDVKLAKDATLSWQRGSVEVASLKGTDASGQLAGIESTISSATKLKLAAAGDENGQISAGVLTLKGGVELELERIDLDASASITSTTAAGVSMNGVTLRLDADNVATSSTVQDASMLVNSFGSAAQATLEAGWAVLDVQASALSGSLTICGSSLMIDFSAFDIEKVDAIRLSFEGEVEFSAQEMMSLMAQTQKGDYVGMYAGDDKASAYFILVPEPATATLSLMALAALVARRRRS